jgi:hypothetical protein
VSGRKQWQYCSYNVSGKGYPGECGSIQPAPVNWASFVDGSAGVKEAAIWLELQDIPPLAVRV